MSDPTTRPPAVIAQNEYEFRVEVLTKLTELTTVQAAHADRDDERFADHGKRLDALEDRTDGVRSSYAEGNGVREFLRDIIPWLVAVGAVVGWLWERKP